MLLQEIQSDIEKLYHIGPEIAVEDFVSETTYSDGRGGWLDYEFGEDTADLMIHFSREISDWLNEASLDHIDFDNFGKYCTVVEEVSHLNYIIWKCTEKDVNPARLSRLELEIQGGVDQFIVLLEHILQETSGYPVNLREHLFEKYDLYEDDSPELKELSESANHFANLYCRELEIRMTSCSRKELLEDLREFYNMGQIDKIRTIMRLSH